jgi:hypothetical protein
MDPEVFRIFVKVAAELQCEAPDMPPDYIPVRAAVEAKYPGLTKEADNPYVELAGLGTLAVPSVANMMGHPVSDRTKDLTEVGGLGILAAPYAHQLAMKNSRYAGLAGRLGGALKRTVAPVMHAA